MINKKSSLAESVTPTSQSEVPISPAILKTKRELAKEKLEKLIKEESRLVKGIFQCFETPGSTVKITVRKYPNIPPFEKTMTDGEMYEIPLYVARHLNGIDASAGAAADPDLRNPNIGTCSYPVHGFLMKNKDSLPMSSPVGMIEGHSGIPVPIVGVAKRVKRFGFQSMEFAGAEV
jgi:hypothetical protein